MNSKRFTTIPLLAAVLAASTSALAQDRAKVRTTAPEPAMQSRAYPIPGRTEPYEFTAIFTRATGIVKERLFDIGDTVKTGDVLAIIDVPEIDRAVDSAKAAVDQALARYNNARTLADRARTLLESRAISREEAEQRIANATEYDAAVRLAEAQLASFQEQQKFATVRAPFDGIISGRNFNRGDRVRGDAATSEGWLYRLVRLDQLRFVIAAPPDLAMQVKDGVIAQITFNELPGRTLEAKVYRRSDVFDQASGTMRVELLLPNPDLSIPSGLTGNATFTLAPTPDRYLVPTNTLVMNRGAGSLRAVVDGKVQTIGVSVGRSLGARVEVVSSALNRDLRLIVNPNAMLRDGDAVEIITNTEAAAQGR